jgi:hypothetical protein
MESILDSVVTCTSCGSDSTWAVGCGAFVCEVCEDHKGLVRCYCGWDSYVPEDGEPPEPLE